MNDDIAISVRNVCKKYHIYEDKAHTIKDRIINLKRNKRKNRVVLDGISFKIKKGEAVGLIGQNGCGKSTTLKLLSKIIYPDSGEIEIGGRVSSLLELGAGFHPDMSGRENIYTNAAIFGLSRKEIDERIGSIIEFSELEDYIDNPVRTYSSGMYMRLAFSVAINVNADILLIDEILAVGDVNFQKKCLDRIKEIKKAGTTIVIVSHSMGQIEDVCDKAIWLEKGKVKQIGCVEEVAKDYRDEMEEKRLGKLRSENTEVTTQMGSSFSKLTIREGTGKVRFTEVLLKDSKEVEQPIFNKLSAMHLEATYENYQNIPDATITISIARDDGILCFATSSDIFYASQVHIKKAGKVIIHFENDDLLDGRYMINLGIRSRGEEVYDDLQRVKYFQIDSQGVEKGIIRINTCWRIE